MPLYDYSCTQHGTIELSLPMSHEAQVCPRCGRALTRVYSLTPVIYKVGGFYSIDSGQRYESQLTPRGKEIYREAKHKAGQ